jgi:hypothetical protein
VHAGVTEAGQLDATTAAHNAAMRAYGYRTEATGYQATAGLEHMHSQQAQTAGAFNSDIICM